MRGILLVVAMLLTGAWHSEAEAQVLRQQAESWAERCNNDAGDYSVDVSERACTAIIRSDIATSPARAAAYHRRGTIALERGDQARAMADFTQAVNFNPHFTVAFISRAALHETQGAFEQAIADYDQVIRIAPDFAAAYNARCWLRARSGRDLDLGRRDCDRALAMTDGAPVVYDSRAMLSMREERYEEAWRDYDAAIQADETSAHSRYGRGVAAMRLGRVEEAQGDLAAALAADPSLAATYVTYGVTP